MQYTGEKQMTTISRRCRPRSTAAMLVMALLVLLPGGARGQSRDFLRRSAGKFRTCSMPYEGRSWRSTTIPRLAERTCKPPTIPPPLTFAMPLRPTVPWGNRLVCSAAQRLTHVFRATVSDGERGLWVEHGHVRRFVLRDLGEAGERCCATRCASGRPVGEHQWSHAYTRKSLAARYLYRLLRPQPRLQVRMRSPGGDARTLDLASKVRERSRIVDLTGANGGRDMNQMLRDGETDREEMNGGYVEYGDSIIIWKMPTFSVTLDEVHEMMKHARKRKALVIDLRGDGGGYAQSMLELVKQVNRDSVMIGTTHARRKTTPLVAKGGGDAAFGGQVFVLVDSRSASASEIFARTMQLTGRGKVIGDRTAGAVMESLFHSLTIGMDTKIFFGVQVTEADVVMSDGGRLERVGVAPDRASGARIRGSRRHARSRARSRAHAGRRDDQCGDGGNVIWGYEALAQMWPDQRASFASSSSGQRSTGFSGFERSS